MKSGKLFLLVIFLLFGQALRATSLTGTVMQVYQDKHYVFRNFNTAKGYVRLNNGFTILAGQSAALDTFITVSGAIDLRTTGSLDLRGDLFLDAHVTWSSSGKIYGRGNAIHLGGSLSLPTDTIVQFIDDTVIDGDGHTLTLGAHAQLLLASDVSLTLKNMTIKTTRNSTNIPIIRCFDQKGHVTLDNVELALSDDFPFRTGRMFFKNDVMVTGTSKFIYQSVMQSYVAAQSLLAFDPGTTLYYYPSSADKDLLQLSDKSSGVYLKGSGTTLQTTHTGMQLTKGRLWMDNKITLSTRANTNLDIVLLVADYNYGLTVRGVDWSPSGRYLAVVGAAPNSGQELEIVSFNGTSLVKKTGASLGGGGVRVRWSSDERFFLVGCQNADSDVFLYEFNGTSLTLLQGLSLVSAFGSVEGVAWSPDNRHAVFGMRLSLSGNELQLYRFNYPTLTFVQGINLGTLASSRAEGLSWHPTGKFLAVGATDPTSGSELQIYSFNGSTLSLLTSADYGAAGSNVMTVAFSPDGNFLAIGGSEPTNGNEFQVYSFDGTSLSLIDSKNFGVFISISVGSFVEEVKWDPSGRYIAIVGPAPASGKELQIYEFNGTSLTLASSQNYGIWLYGVSWTRDGKYIAIGGQTPAVGLDDVDVYSVAYRFDTRTQALTNGLTLGNSSLGSSYDLDTYVLSGATVNLAGQLMYDSTS